MAKPVSNLDTGLDYYCTRFINIIESFSLLDILDKYLHRLKLKYTNKLCDSLNVFTLSIEGAYNHVDDLSIVEANNLLVKLDKTIYELTNSFESILNNKDLASSLLKKSYKTALKSIYKLESKVYKIAHKNSEAIQTSEALKSGFVKLQKSSISTFSK